MKFDVQTRDIEPIVENVYHVHDMNMRVTQELKLMKVREAAGTVCYVLPLNSSDNALPKEVLNASAPVSSNILYVWFYSSSVEYKYYS